MGGKEFQQWVVDAKLVDERVTDSYLLVVESLPKYKQPVNPRIFAAYK